jgi:hypothetical protein
LSRPPCLVWVFWPLSWWSCPATGVVGGRPLGHPVSASHAIRGLKRNVANKTSKRLRD